MLFWLYVAISIIWGGPLITAVLAFVASRYSISVRRIFSDQSTNGDAPLTPIGAVSYQSQVGDNTGNAAAARCESAPAAQ